MIYTRRFILRAQNSFKLTSYTKIKLVNFINSSQPTNQSNMCWIVFKFNFEDHRTFCLFLYSFIDSGSLLVIMYFKTVALNCFLNDLKLTHLTWQVNVLLWESCATKLHISLVNEPSSLGDMLSLFTNKENNRTLLSYWKGKKY